jgi:CTP synthase (UTP-ammonia lyase)
VARDQSCLRMAAIRIGLIGDFNPEVVAHPAIPRALELTAASLHSAQVETTWLPTATLAHEPDEKLLGFHGLWCVPGSPYVSMKGALLAIRFARINRVPFLGTCGGFQHALIEYARNVLGLTDADHTETNPCAVLPLVSQLSCSLIEKDGLVLLQEGSQIRRSDGTAEILESYHCNYGLNPACQDLFKSRKSFRISGQDTAGEPRVIELRDHPFFMATLFQPERSALRGHVHPLVSAFLQAIIECNCST